LKMSSPDNISRSGRVRKKSSKLTDFQSPDESGRQRPRSSPRKDELSGSIFDPVVDLDSDSDAGTDLETELDHLDFSLEDLGELEDLSTLPRRAEIVKKPLNLPLVQEVSKSTAPKITAFLVWAKHTKAAVIKDNPDLGPSALRIKLGELWNTVPKAEKLAWSKKGKKLQTKGSTPVRNLMMSPPALRSPLGSPVPETRGVPGLGLMPETETINIASHLKLLGESLSVIGERLTEHEGQIAVSGSLSVLLDSLLCAMGTVINLTTRVPELNGADPLVLSETLDNVAYIMPGL